ncbi:CurL C-terminal domain-containing protein [Streptomyces sp. NPDC054770]
MADPQTRPTAPPDPDARRVLALSAHDPESLAEMRRRLAAWLDDAPDTDPDDVALTLQTGRERFPCRDAVVGTRTDELARLLRERNVADAGPVGTPGDGPVLVLDGSPATAGAGRALPEVADALRLAEHLCRDNGDPAAARSVAVQYGVAAWLRARRVVPSAVRGEGPGALAAAAVRGDLPLPDALRAAATGVPARVEGVTRSGGEGETRPRDEAIARAQAGGDGTGPAAVRPGTTVVRIGGSRPDAPGEPGVLVLDPADDASYARLLAELWCLGFDVDTTLGRPGRRVRLPGHPFRRREPGGAGPADAPETRALTPYEQRWLFYDLVRHGSSGDHIVTAEAVLDGPPPVARTLAAAFAELQRRHPALRTVFSEPGGRWRARTLPAPAARPDHLAADPAGGPQELREAVRRAARQPLSLRDTPLVRCCVRSGAAHWALSLAMYEPLTAAADPRLLLDELVALVGAGRPGGAPLPEPERV